MVTTIGPPQPIQYSCKWLDWVIVLSRNTKVGQLSKDQLFLTTVSDDVALNDDVHFPSL